MARSRKSTGLPSHIETYLYGCRSGIQKAIRRRDLDLLHTTFEALWEGPSSFRHWLIWRTPVLVTEDVWYTIGEYAKLWSQAVNLTPEEQKPLYKRFLTRLALLPKSRDAGGLLAMAHHYLDSGKEPDHPELVTMMRVVRRIKEAGFRDAADWVQYCLTTANGGLMDSPRKLPPYEQAAVDYLRLRADQQGMFWDMQTYLATMVLIAHRGLVEAEVQELIDQEVEKARASGPHTLKKVPLPWYVFDMHTRVGLGAMRQVAPQYENRVDNFKLLWFQMESAKLDRFHPVPYKSTPEPGMLDSIWWVEEVRHTGLRSSVLSPQDVARLWKSEIRPKLKEAVLEGARRALSC